MPKEIERKFLVAASSWRRDAMTRMLLRDGLIAYSDSRKVRVRLINSDRAFITVKGPRQGFVRSEYEYEIPFAEGLEMLQTLCGDTILEKTRHLIRHAGYQWSVDEYHGLLDGILIAEIELPNENATFVPPPWLGREVTGQQAYRKVNMVKARLAQNASCA